MRSSCAQGNVECLDTDPNMLAVFDATWMLPLGALAFIAVIAAIVVFVVRSRR